MAGVIFDRKWEINTDDDFLKAIEILDGDEFIANMSDSYARTAAEVAEVNRQRKEVILQAMAKGIISGRVDHGKETNGCQARSNCSI